MPSIKKDQVFAESESANASLAKPFFGQALPAELFNDRRLNISNL